MGDTAAELLDGMRDMRIRRAILVTALRRLGAPLPVTREDAYDAAGHDIEVQHVENGFVVTLKDAPR